MKTLHAALFTIGLALLPVSACFAGPFGPVPVLGPTVHFAGLISPTQTDIELHELIYFATDGTGYFSAAGALTGTCTAGSTCSIGADLSYNAPPSFTPTSVAYSIIGFYRDPLNATFGPQFPSDFSDCYFPLGGPGCTVIPGAYAVVSNPNVFAVTSPGWSFDPLNLLQPGFVQFFDPSGVLSFGQLTAENGVANQFYNGNIVLADSIPANAYLNMPTIPLGGALTGGNITNFSDGTPNGTVTLSAQLTPEPSFTLILAGFFVALLIFRARRKTALRSCA